MIFAGEIVVGTVVACESFGAFVTHDEVQYFVPLHELCWRNLRHASEAVSVGDQCEILVDRPDHSSAGGPLASVRRVHPELNPWLDPSVYSVGTIYSGPIANKLDYGWFVTHPVGVDGLLHSGDLPTAFDASLGDVILVEIIECNVEMKQIRLSLVGLP